MIEHIRSYEVSIWTLQDSFITVLKPSNLEPKGQIQNPNMNLKDSNDDTFSFRIPMYLNFEDTFIENPIWYTTRNGNIIANMRKVKVIFNKGEKEFEKVFEFLITNVKEEHEGFAKYCQVDCEGLAFHELGKQGYKITLSGVEDVDYDQQEWTKNTSPLDENRPQMPYPNINYWVEKVLKNSIWRYSICMDWSAQDGIVDISSEAYLKMTEEERKIFNTDRQDKGLRRKDRLYEDTYVSSWNKDDDVLIPAGLNFQKEKYRLIESSESNRYNLLQTIAETFQVFVKYVYHYDDNYHIIDREVIFYNNFLNENNEVIDFTFKYNTASLSREMDGTELVSKMFVKPLVDNNTISGQAIISDTDANKSLEDYILNFDYLYHIGTISKEQYEGISEFEIKMHDINAQLIQLSEDIILLESELPEQEAKRDNALAAIGADQENITSNSALFNAVTDDTGRVPERPQSLYLIKEDDNSGFYYANIRTEGVVANTIRIYRRYNFSTFELSDEITTFTVETDEMGNVVKIKRLRNVGAQTDTVLYATYSYIPNLKYDNIIKAYTKRLAKDQKDYEDAKNRVNEINTEIEDKKEQYTNWMEEKDKALMLFERLMGPALREGVWQPENEYSGYGDFKDEVLSINNNTSFSSDLISIGWNDEPFDSEQLNYYQEGINQEEIYYPCVNLSNYIGRFKGKEISTISFIYDDVDDNYISDGSGAYPPGDPRAFQYFPIGSRAQLGFIQLKTGGNTIPVLFVTGAAQTSITDWTTVNKNARIGIAEAETYTDTDGIEKIRIKEESIVKHSEMEWINNPNNYKVVYPRIQVNSPLMKNNMQQIALKQKVENRYISLEGYSDYYVSYRNRKYYITIKPENFFNVGVLNNVFNTNVTISNTALAIYLDAIQVLKENSIPKVSYTIEPAMTNKIFTHDAYNRLAQLAHINDYELKFENVMGYISELQLDLDMPQHDKAIIKNYKTKFEDLFSSIVAETESIKKNSYIFNAFNSATGTLSNNIINNITERINFDGIVDNSDYSRAEKVNAAAAQARAEMANSTALKVMNGDIGLAFAGGNSIESATLNRDDGLVISGFLEEGSDEIGIFRVTNYAMGFFKKDASGNESASLYFEDGDLALSGKIFASGGRIGGESGWTIGEKILYTGNMTPGYDSNTITISTGMDSRENIGGSVAGIKRTWALSVGKNFGVTTGGYIFATNAIISGKITATSGYIGGTNGWHIADKTLWTGNETPGFDSSTIVLSTGKASTKPIGDSGTEEKTWALTIGQNFGVTTDGKIFATNAKIKGDLQVGTGASIGGWTVSDNSLYYLNDTPGNSSTNVILSGFGKYGVHPVTGTDTSSKYWVISAGKKFGVTDQGILYAAGAYISGTITANYGKIGNWTINNNAIQNGLTTLESNGKITTGNINATGGNIGGWSLSGGALSNGSVTLQSNGVISSNGSMTLSGIATVNYNVALSDGGFTYSYEGKTAYIGPYIISENAGGYSCGIMIKITQGNEVLCEFNMSDNGWARFYRKSSSGATSVQYVF